MVRNLTNQLLQSIVMKKVHSSHLQMQGLHKTVKVSELTVAF